MLTPFLATTAIGPFMALALIVAGALAGLMAVPGLDLVGAMAAVKTEFGVTAGRLGLTIALAAVIGASLMESGAADRIVRTLIVRCGVRQAPLALLLGAFLLSGPVFVDTVLLLLLPIARLLSVRRAAAPSFTCSS
jgi:GntP family gluconate:H+ symporter